MKIVNGYVCECSDEVRLAKRGIDPANPRNDPEIARELAEKSAATSARPVDAAEGGALDPKRDDAADQFADAALIFGGMLEGTKVADFARKISQLVDKYV